MVSTGLHNVGEEWSQKTNFRQDLLTRDTTLDVLLFDDSTDGLTDSSDIGDITTEPNDGNYTRQSFTLDSVDVTISQVSGDIRAEVTVTFDVTNSTGSVDAAATVVDFQSDVVNSEAAQNPHLLQSATLDFGTADLTQFNNLEVTQRIDLT